MYSIIKLFCSFLQTKSQGMDGEAGVLDAYLLIVAKVDKWPSTDPEMSRGEHDIVMELFCSFQHDHPTTKRKKK